MERHERGQHTLGSEPTAAPTLGHPAARAPLRPPSTRYSPTPGPPPASRPRTLRCASGCCREGGSWGASSLELAGKFGAIAPAHLRRTRLDMFQRPRKRWPLCTRHPASPTHQGDHLEECSTTCWLPVRSRMRWPAWPMSRCADNRCTDALCSGQTTGWHTAARRRDTVAVRLSATGSYGPLALAARGGVSALL